MAGYWREILSGVEPCRFPTLNDGENLTGETGSSEILLYETSRLMCLCEREGILPFVVFQTAWAIILRSYIHSDSICFASFMSGNDSTDGTNLDATNPLPGLLICSTIITEGSVVKQLSEMQAKLDREMPFKVQSSAEINQILNVPARQLFNTAISVNRQSCSAFPIQTIFLPDKGGVIEHDLIMNITHFNDQIGIMLKYDCSILTESQATSVARTFLMILREIVINPERNIERFTFCSEHDQKQIWNWNSTMPDKIDRCVHDLIEDQARLHPDSLAICSWDGNMTYGELNMFSARLAHHLINLGVGPEVMVPLCFEKSKWAIVAMLAVLKAGGAFVPLDPSHPIDRLERIIIQVNSSVLLSSTQHEHLFSSATNSVIDVSELTLAQLPAESKISDTSVCPSNASYVIFTSGSSGVPKGCVIEHATYCSSALAHGKITHVESRSRVLQFASYGFDACLAEILTTLIFGATICVPSEDERINNLVGAMNRMSVNWACFVPSIARLIKPENVPHLETLLLVGESASQGDLEKWVGRVQLINGYGPTECAVGCVYHEFTGEKLVARCIGRGVGVNCWIVDALDANILSPIGAVGELLIQGPSVGRGYLNDKEKTNTVFLESLSWIPDDGTGQRQQLYKTGDLVRYNTDGTINFLGRKDAQVKLRGQRIELGEIEHHLVASKGVKNATIVACDSRTRNRRLVAVVSLQEIGTALEAERSNEIQVISQPRKRVAAAKISTIRENMSRKLPAFMIPTIWIVVEDLPSLVSGKLDKAKAAKWVMSMSDEELRAHSEFLSKEAQLDPGTALEERLQRIWSQVLNLPLEKVTMESSFWNLGGDSISAMHVVARCRAENIVVAAQDILRCKTIPQLSLYLQTAGDPHYMSESETEDPVNTPFGLSPIQQLYFYSMLNGNPHFNQSFLLQFTEKISVENIALAIQAIVKQHSMLRARFRCEPDGRWTQRIIPEVLESYHFRCHSTTSMDGIASIVKVAQASLDFRDGPLFAAELFDDGGKKIIFLTAHHLVIDLVSWRIILADLEEFLRFGAISGPKPLPFQAWNRAQNKYCQQNLKPSNTLPFDLREVDYEFWGMAQRLNQFKDTLTERFALERDMTTKLFGICNNALRTEPIELLLSAIIHSFSRIFPERRTPTIFNEHHGREPWDASIDLSRTVGWFTVLCPLWVPVDDQQDVVKTIRCIKDQRRRVPDNGWSYFTSRFIHPEGHQAFASYSNMEVLFNYEGMYQQLERKNALLRQLPWANPQAVDGYDGDGHRITLLELTATVKHDVLHLCFEYNRHMNHKDRITRWVRECEHTLKEAVEHLMQRKTEHTLSDFPLLPLSYANLARFVNTTLPGIGILNLDEIEDAYPCSPLQQGILVSQTKQPTLYRIQVVQETVPAEGCSSIDVQRLGEAWQKVVDRHAILRTIFVENMCEDGNFGQVVLKKTIAETCYIELDGDSDDEDDSARALVSRSFDNGGKYQPPHRLTIYATSGGRILFNLEISHTLTDGISLSFILRDLRLAYDGILPGVPGQLYRNFVSYIQGQNTTRGIEYWREYVKNIVPCNFPALAQGSNQQAGSGTVDNSFDAFQLRAFCQQYGVSIYSVLQTAWALVLRTYVGKDEVCFGYISSGRDIPIHQTQDAIGPYISMLICRVGFSHTEPISDVLRRAHDEFVNGLAHQHSCSLAQIQHELKMSGKPLFNTGISLQKAQIESCQSSNLKIRDIRLEDPSEHDLALNAVESKETISLTFRYLKRSIPVEHMPKIAYSFARFLGEITANPKQTVQQLSLVSEGDREQSWNSMPDKIDACKLGEIENHLRSFLPNKADVVAEISTIAGEERQPILVAFICLPSNFGGEDCDLEDISVATRERLISIVTEVDKQPLNSLLGYKIPTIFIPLKRIPLTVSSQIDRQKLRQLVSGLSEQQLTARSLNATVKQAPSEMEKRLQQIWSKVLDVQTDSIGVNNDFFNSGGDSILAMRLVTTARSSGIHISVADIFNHPTLSELSLFITVTEGITHGQVRISQYTSSGDSKNIESFLQDASLQCATSQTSLEIRARLQQIWAEGLNIQIDSVGISDSFFSLGGDSILAMRLVAASCSAGIHISVTDIFSHPTLLELSQALCIPDRLDRSVHGHGHRQFSSLNFPDIGEFLEEVVCPQVASGRSNIEDALVATDMQAAMIAFGFSKKRGNVHYFTLDFDGHIDSQRLEIACQTLISHHPILRTVFFAYKSQVFQIVLRSVPLAFQQYRCENSIEDLSEQLINADRSLPFQPGDRIIRFMLLNRASSSSRLILRVSHAQYDGICFPTIIRDLKTGYLGEKIAARPPFSNFIYAINGRNETEAELFWRAFLKNSSMTSFSLHKTPSYENHTDSIVMQSVPYIPLTSHGITLASLIRASWAFVLAQLSGESDVVFGHVVSGRNLPLEGIDRIVGPCVNVVPVRVRFKYLTVLDLLRLVQNQHLESIPFETMGFRRIVKQCTKWPLWTRFGSVVQHQNLDEILTSCHFGDINCKIGAANSPYDVVDVAIFSSLQGRRTEVSLNFSKQVIPQSFAKEVLESLCSTILRFSKDVNTQLPLPSSWSTLSPRIPLPNVNGGVQVLCDAEPSKATVACQLVVERAWKFVIKAGDGDCADTFCDPNIPFFDIWGDLNAAAQLSAFYRREGIHVEINEILCHPTMRLQTLLIAQRLGGK